MPSFVLGIDLGTTNSVLAYASLADDQPEVKILPIPQLIAPGVVEERTSKKEKAEPMTCLGARGMQSPSARLPAA